MDRERESSVWFAQMEICVFTGHVSGFHFERIGRKVIHGLLQYVCEHTASGPDAAEPRNDGDPTSWSNGTGTVLFHRKKKV